MLINTQEINMTAIHSFLVTSHIVVGAAALVLFLCSPLADAIHGQNIRIDGGAVDIVS